jgi:hypothetical protein
MARKITFGSVWTSFEFSIKANSTPIVIWMTTLATVKISVLLTAFQKFGSPSTVR